MCTRAYRKPKWAKKTEPRLKSNSSETSPKMIRSWKTFLFKLKIRSSWLGSTKSRRLKMLLLQLKKARKQLHLCAQRKQPTERRQQSLCSKSNRSIIIIIRFIHLRDHLLKCWVNLTVPRLWYLRKKPFRHPNVAYWPKPQTSQFTTRRKRWSSFKMLSLWRRVSSVSRWVWKIAR